MKINVIYEDADILAIDKPAGLKAHHDENAEEPALTDWIVENYPEIKKVGEPMKIEAGVVIERPGIVHRLDKETSGVLLIAKTESALNYLKELFKEKKIQKVYNCFVAGAPTPREGIIDSSIKRSAKDFRKKVATNSEGEGREALTRYKTLKTNGEFSFVEAMPKTGRTHQIRAHLKSINCPIVCDPLYSNKSELKKIEGGGECPLGFSRLALHARSISFKNLKGEALMLEADLPECFRDAYNKL